MYEMFDQKLPENWVDPDPTDMTWEHQKEETVGMFSLREADYRLYYNTDFTKLPSFIKKPHSASENSACRPESPGTDR